MGDYLVTLNLPLLIASFGIPTAVTGFFVWLLQRHISKRDAKEARERDNRQKQIDERDDRQERLMYNIIQLLQADHEVMLATAKAVQRIPDAQCNGDMRRALEYAEGVRKTMRSQLDKDAVANILD